MAGHIWFRIIIATFVATGLSHNASGQDAPPPAVVVAIHTQAGVQADTVSRAKDEVTRIYGESGVQIVWAEAGARRALDAFRIQLIVRMRAPDGGTALRGVMGTALGDRHDDGGTAFVYRDRIVRLAHECNQDVARLLAYAIAHEIGHLLLPHPAHSRTGIMRAEWDGDDLRHIAGGLLQFTADQTAAMRTKASACCHVAPLSTTR